MKCNIGSVQCTNCQKQEERREQKWEERRSSREERKDYILSEVLRPTGVLGPIIFSWLVGCVICDISTLCSGTCNLWASFNWWHCCSCMCEPCLLLQMASCSVSYSVGTSLNMCPILSSWLPVPTGTIKTIQHPHRIGPVKPVIVVPIPNPIITTVMNCIVGGWRTECGRYFYRGIVTKSGQSRSWSWSPDGVTVMRQFSFSLCAVPPRSFLHLNLWGVKVD